MADTVRLAFERRLLTIGLSALLPLKKVSERVKATAKYRRIAASVAEVGIIEPLVVSRTDDPNQFLLLDGHMRLEALIATGALEARCLLADDDEAFTYNKRVNRLATVQEHYMIVRALDEGVPEEKLAKALDIDIKLVKRRKTLLDRICPEAVDILKDKSVNPVTFDVLRRMKPIRQIEVADLMLIAANYTSSYAKALLAATRPGDLVKPDKPKRIAGLTPEQIARMERETESTRQDFKAIDASYGDDVLHLVIASGYLSKLLANPEIRRFLAEKHREILEKFQSLIAASSLDQTSSEAT